jgi:hypothetical protein
LIQGIVADLYRKNYDLLLVLAHTESDFSSPRYARYQLNVPAYLDKPILYKAAENTAPQDRGLCLRQQQLCNPRERGPRSVSSSKVKKSRKEETGKTKAQERGEVR